VTEVMGKPRLSAGRRRLFALVAVGVLVAVSVAAAFTVNLGAPARTRTYFIAADEVEWDYAPQGRNMITGEAFGVIENVSVGSAPDRIGKVYLKAVYREYTDNTFTTLKPKPREWEHTGLLGPTIRAAVGDTIVVNFKNNARYAASVHPHGVFYDKASEGAPYDDGTSGADTADDAVETGGTHTYTWNVPERAGPGLHDGTSIMWMYHSHVDEAGEVNAGLVGAMIIAKRGMLLDNGKIQGVDREFVMYFSVIDETRSPYLWDNVGRYVQDQSAVELEIALAGLEAPETYRPCARETDARLQALCLREGGFVESNLKHAINGYLWGNGPPISMKLGEKVRWYMMTLGSEIDLHTPHWHGGTLLWMNMRTDMIQLLPGSMMTLDMVPDNAGTWMFHCHVNDHLDGGMIATFQVTA
jgi:FtsP/CotA-like multicopper oxidase with cupredoxin domain